MIKTIWLPKIKRYAIMKYTDIGYGPREEMLSTHKYWLVAELFLVTIP